MKVAGGAALLLALGAAGCESTQDKSARLSLGAKQAVQQKGLQVTKASTEVVVGDSRVLRDDNGTAVVAELRNTGSRTLLDIPVSIDVKDAAGASVFVNDNPGAERGLVSVTALGPGESIEWVHDQVQPTARPASVQVTVGDAKGETSGTLPKMEIGGQALEDDPVSGVAVAASLRNTAGVGQRELTVFAVARKGGKVVAAGRALIPRVGPQREVKFAVFFIGDPKGAQVTMAAPPTTPG